MKNVLRSLLLLAGSFGAMSAAQAQVRITEVDSGASGSTSYAFDWFELTNFGSTAVDITGWKVDDNSNSFGSALVLGGITFIQPGQSVIFAEGGVASSFIANWFSALHPAPGNFQFGTYSGSSIGLSTGGDAVNIYNASGGLITRVDVGATTNPNFASFDNSSGTGTNLTTMSLAGINGAYAGLDGRVGSPGSISAVPLPAGVWLLLSGLGALGANARRRKAAGRAIGA